MGQRGRRCTRRWLTCSGSTSHSQWQLPWEHQPRWDPPASPGRYISAGQGRGQHFSVRRWCSTLTLVDVPTVMQWQVPLQWYSSCAMPGRQWTRVLRQLLGALDGLPIFSMRKETRIQRSILVLLSCVFVFCRMEMLQLPSELVVALGNWTLRPRAARIWQFCSLFSCCLRSFSRV